MPETETPEVTETEPQGTPQETSPSEVAGPFRQRDEQPSESPADPTDQLPDDHPLVKALAAQKATIKELKAKAARLDEIEEAQKSELQKAVERAEAAEGALATMQAAKQIQEWKTQVSKMKKYEGVPASALRGTSLEELEEHAAELKALLPEPRKPGHVPAEGQSVSDGSGDPAQQFAELIRNARR